MCKHKWTVHMEKTSLYTSNELASDYLVWRLLFSISSLASFLSALSAIQSCWRTFQSSSLCVAFDSFSLEILSLSLLPVIFSPIPLHGSPFLLPFTFLRNSLLAATLPLTPFMMSIRINLGAGWISHADCRTRLSFPSHLFYFPLQTTWNHSFQLITLWESPCLCRNVVKPVKLCYQIYLKRIILLKKRKQKYVFLQ